MGKFIVVLLVSLFAIMPAQAARRVDKGPAPAGCWWGPRGGLHCAKHVKSSSEESATQRDKRLKRECRGRPNAGACLGYTR